jgi:hypothetical protein
MDATDPADGGTVLGQRRSPSAGAMPGLTVFVGRALSRSGRAFLTDVFGGNESMGEAVTRLLVVAFYLLNLGFVTLTMKTSGSISSVRLGIQALSVKIGEELLVVGALHLANLALFARLRRRARAEDPPTAQVRHGLQ